MISVFFPASVQAENCGSIRFKQGESSHTIQGIAPIDEGVCYKFTARAGQTADIAITGNNVIFSIEGVTDVQDKYSFTTDKKTYQIFVWQLMRASTSQHFSLSISIK